MRIGKFRMDWVSTVPPISMKLDPSVVTKVNANPYIDKTYRAPFTKSDLVAFIKTSVYMLILGLVVFSLFFVFRALDIEDYNNDVWMTGVMVASVGSFLLIMFYAIWVRDAISGLKWDWNVLHKLGYYRHWHLKFAETDYEKMRRENKDGRLPRPEEEEWRGMDD